jgi:hypothetical protein
MNPNEHHVFPKPNVINTSVRITKFALNMSRCFESVWSLEPNKHINIEEVHTISKCISSQLCLTFLFLI